MTSSPSRGRHRLARDRPARPRHARPSGGRHRGAGSRAGRRTLVVLGTTVLLLAGVGVAGAAWFTTGTGPASGQARAAQPVVIAAATASADLYPGSSGSVRLTVTNPNPYPVRLTQASFGTVTAAPLQGRTCSAAVEAGNIQVLASPVTLSPAVVVAAGATSGPVPIPSALHMPPTADNGCQDATFTLTVTLTGTSTST